MIHRNALERREMKRDSCEVTPQALWTISNPLIKRDGPKVPTVIHGLLSFIFYALEEVKTISDSLENQFTPHDLCHINHEGRVEARVQTLLVAVDKSPPVRIRPCDF
jgi:hypothetical protein